MKRRRPTTSAPSRTWSSSSAPKVMRWRSPGFARSWTWLALTRVPGGMRSLMGLYNLRGHVVPVWNLRIPFHLNDDRPQERAPSVLMVEPDAAQPSRVAGLLVDRVSDVLDFAPGDIQPAPTLGLGGGSKFVRGLIRHQERFLLVLDLDRVFAALLEDPSNEAP